MKMEDVNETKRLLNQITDDWDELQEDMGEMAALEVACQMNGVPNSQWYWDSIANLDE